MNTKLQSLGVWAYTIAVLICIALAAIGFGASYVLEASRPFYVLLMMAALLMLWAGNRDGYPQSLWSMPPVGIILATFHGTTAWVSALPLFGVFIVGTGLDWAHTVRKTDGVAA